mgnify:CR=1 FL=1
MKSGPLSILTLLLVVAVSMLIMIAPTFFTKGVSRVSLNKKIDLALIANGEKDIKILFFGYSGCVDVCTPRLYALDKFYKSLDEKTRERVGVEFLDVSTPEDKTLPDKFAKFFNKEFKGVYMDKSVLYDYTRAFDVYFAPGLMDETEYDHTSNVYLVKKTKDAKTLRYVYNAYPYDFKQMELDIKELMND